MIFYKQLDKIDPADPAKAILAMERQIRYIQDQLEYTLVNLDSSNITEIDTDITDITSPGESDSILGLLYLTGNRLRLDIIPTEMNLYSVYPVRTGFSICICHRTGTWLFPKIHR